MSNRLIAAGLIVGAVALAVYIGVAEKRSEPTPAVVQVAAPAAPVPAASPKVLATVVDVLDIEPLLDPPSIPHSEPALPGVVRIAFEDDQPAPVAPTTPAPATIPLAIE